MIFRKPGFFRLWIMIQIYDKPNIVKKIFLWMTMFLKSSIVLNFLMETDGDSRVPKKF